MSLGITDGKLDVLYAGQRILSLSGLAADAEVAADAITASASAGADLWQNAKAGLTITPGSLAATAKLQLSGLRLPALLEVAGVQGELRVPAGTVDANLDAGTDGRESIRATATMAAPALTVARGTRTLDLGRVRAALDARRDGAALTVSLTQLQIGDHVPAATGTLRAKPDGSGPSAELQVPALDLGRLRAAALALAGDLDAVKTATSVRHRGRRAEPEGERRRQRLRFARDARIGPRRGADRCGRPRVSGHRDLDRQRQRQSRPRRRHAPRERARRRDRRLDVQGRDARARARPGGGAARARRGRRCGPRRDARDRAARPREETARGARRRRIAPRPRGGHGGLRGAPSPSARDGRPRAAAGERTLPRRADADRGDPRRGPLRGRSRRRARTRRHPRPLEHPGRRARARARRRAGRAQRERGRGDPARRVLSVARVVRRAAAAGRGGVERDRHRGRAARAAVGSVERARRRSTTRRSSGRSRCGSRAPRCLRR